MCVLDQRKRKPTYEARTAPYDVYTTGFTLVCISKTKGVSLSFANNGLL